MQGISHGTGPRRAAKTIAGKMRPAVNATQQQMYEQYQHALQLMQESKFEKARVIFEKLSADAPIELQERLRVYLAVCDRHRSRPGLEFQSLEEHYDYAISLLNTGYYEDARDHFDAILKRNEAADFAHYGLAILHSITGQAEECLNHLGRAIELNEKNRVQARNDPDFRDMADDPRFTELLYPEA